MTITDTVLVFVCIPLGVVLLVFAIVFGGPSGRGKRYRPGRPFGTAPVWFLAEEDHVVPKTLALVAGDAGHQGEVGGASDNW